MLPSGVWGFLTAVLIVAVGAYLWSVDIFGLRSSFGSGSRSNTLLCTGGEGAACCHKEPHEYASGMAITINREKGLVYVYVEGQGSGSGTILEDEGGHLLFGRKPNEPCLDTDTEGCKVADGEINRLTGIADVRIKDRNNRTLGEWDKLECRSRWRRF
jgi:hypothetical protein